MLEIEREKAHLAGNLRAWLLPPESSRNHEVKHEKELSLGFEHNPLAEATKVDDRAPDHRGERRVDGSQEERGGEPDAGNPASDNPRAKGVKVEKYVGKLWHAARIRSCARGADG